MVTPVSLAIEKYMEGLPPQIHDSVMGSKPATVEDAIRLAASLTDKHVKDGTLTRKGTKRSTETPATTEPSQENSASASSSNKKRIGGNQNYAVVAPLNQVPVANPPTAPQSTPKAYTGKQPQCATCHYHHPTNLPCRKCDACGRLGHTTPFCRIANRPMNNPQTATQNQGADQPRVCYACGDPNHMQNRCPHLTAFIQARQQTPAVPAAPAVPAIQAAPARGRAFNINANQDQATNDVVNGTFLIANYYVSILLLPARI